MDKIKKIKDITTHSKVGLINDLYNIDYEKHIIKWFKEDRDKFQWRKEVSYFQDYISPTINGLASMIFNKSHNIECDELYLDNIDLMGTSLLKFMQSLTINTIKDGIGFIIADTNNIDGSATLSDRNTIRPYLKLYEYANLVSYKIRDNQITQIIFKDKIEIDIDDFESKIIDRYIVYKIGGGSIYHDDKGVTLVSEWVNGLAEIPLSIMYGSLKSHLLTPHPLTYPIAKLNKSHLNLKSGLMNISHIASNPTPILWGLPDNVSGNGTTSIGVNTVITFPTNQNKAYDFQWREIAGTSVQVAEREIKELEHYIIESSFNVLKVDNFNTATEAKLTYNKNKSILTFIANSLEQSIIKSFAFMEQLSNSTIHLKLELNKDFNNIMIDPQIVTALINLKNNGNISLDTLWSTLIDGEVIKIEDYENEKSKILDDLAKGL